MMSTPDWSADDDALMHDLRHAVSEVDLSDEMLTAARAAFTWRTVDAELLALSQDSSLDSASAVRADPASVNRILAFTGHDFTVELEVDEDALVGQLVPGQECRVILTTPDGRVSEDSVSQDGFFYLRYEGRGPVRLQFQTSHLHLATEWISL